MRSPTRRKKLYIKVIIWSLLPTIVILMIVALLTFNSHPDRPSLLLLLAMSIITPPFVAAIVVRQVTKPITELTEAARRMAKGEFGQTVSVKTGDEIETLAGQFNIMSMQLQKSYKNLEQRITERKLAEAELQNNRDHLEESITERTTELQQMNKQLKQEITERERIQLLELEQRTFAEALSDITVSLTGTLRLDEVLDRILESINHVVPHDAASVVLAEDGKIRVLRHHGYEERLSKEQFLSNLQDAVSKPLWKSATKKPGPLMVSDTYQHPDWVMYPDMEWIHSWLGAPIFLEQEVMGAIMLDCDIPGFFQQKHAERLQAFANAAAIAIKNAQLYERSKQVAVLEERQRLARDLHDSVSQTLFSATTLAELIPRMIETHPEKVKTYMRELGELTRTAMSEMRTLLIELRPESLVKTELGVLIKQLCDTFTGKTEIPVTFTLVDKITLSEKKQIAFYRIAQEALNNIAKHAQAGKVEIRLEAQEETVKLDIQDDGQGFDPKSIPINHFGIKIMNERAQSVGAKLTITSQQGVGTKITLQGEK